MTRVASDVSSSDETPLVKNRSLRKVEKQNQLKRMYGAARQQKQETFLPPLLVDHNQLQTIGVQALMSVCDGIGSLFVTERRIDTTTVEAPKQHHKKRSSRRSKQRSKVMTSKPADESNAMQESMSSFEPNIDTIAVEELDVDSDGDVPPPPPLTVESNDLDNSAETSYSWRDEKKSEDATSCEDNASSSMATPESHEIGPAMPLSSRRLEDSLEMEPKTVVLGTMEPTTVEDAPEDTIPSVEPPEPIVEPVAEVQDKPHRRLDMYISKNEDGASVASRETIESQRTDDWSLASAIKNQTAHREFPSYQSLSDHKKSDPDGNKDSSFAVDSNNTSSTMTNTEKESSIDISEPPTLRRLNRSLESIAPEFSANESVAKESYDWPDALSNSQTIPSDEGSKDRSTTLSPMSEFLAERLRDNRYHVNPAQTATAQEGIYDDAKCPEELECPSYSSGPQTDCDTIEHDNEAVKTLIDPLASDGIVTSNPDHLGDVSREEPFDPLSSSGVVESDRDQADVDRRQEFEFDGKTTDESEQSKQSTSRNSSDNTNDLFNSLDQMVHDLQSIASGRFNSGDSQSATTVPSFADALQAETEASLQESVDTDIRRDFLPPNAGYEGLPYLISSINADPGIAKGDIMISLLNNDSCRVKDAVSRCRFLRQYSDVDWLEKKATRRQPGLSVLFNVAEDEEAGGINDVPVLEQAVSQSLKYDNFERAFELCCDINQKYYEYEHTIRDDGELLEKFQLYKATASYNLGIVHLLRGDIEEALMCFDTAVELRTGCKDVTDSEYAVS